MNSYIIGNARFSVLCEGVIRMEYAENGVFVDDKTFFANRNASCDAEFSEKDGVLTVKTDKMTLTYKGGGFSADSLYAVIDTAGVSTVWHYGDVNTDNLGGTLSTVDGVDGYKVGDDGRLYASYATGTEHEFTRIVPEGLIARDGWHVIDDSGTPLISDWAKSRDEAHKVDIYLFAYGHDYLSALRDLTAVSGKAVMPRKYFMGAWYSRWQRYTADEFLQIIDEYDGHGFPLDVLVMDMDWHYQDWADGENYPKAAYGYGHATNLGWTGYSWDRFVIPDPDAFLAEVHRRGIAVTVNDHPADGVRDHEDTYPEFMRILREAGYKEEIADIPERINDRETEGKKRGIENFRYNAGSPVYMDAFFRSTFDKLTAQGVDFFWVDWQQDHIYPEAHGIKGLTHLKWLNYLYYNRLNKDGKRGQSFSRWAGWGDQKHPGAFSGDITTGWASLDFEIRMTVSSGNMGCFWWTHDIGGFCDPTGKQAECYARWVQFGALSAALRTHSCGFVNGVEVDRRPWKWGEPFCNSMRESFMLRSRIMPYLYSAGYIAQRDSIPMIRPLYLEEPENEEAYRHPDTYRFGKSLFVAPIHEGGEGDKYEVTSKVWLPGGEWYDWFTGDRFDGGYAEVTNDINSFPLFAKAGDPIVTQPTKMRMTSALYDELTVKIFAGSGDVSGSNELYEDDGISDVETTQAFRLTEIRYDRVGKTHKVTMKPSGNGFDGAPDKRCLSVELIDVDKPCSISLGELKYEVRYFEESRTALIMIYDVPANDPFSLSLTTV